MKALFILSVIVLFSITTVHAQEYQFQDDLEIIYLSSESSGDSNIFVNEIDSILQKKDYNIRKEISVLRSSIGVGKWTEERLHYLKRLKRAANYTDTAESFENRIFEYNPELKPDFINRVKLNMVYEIIRKDTFNGRLDALPSVL